MKILIALALIVAMPVISEAIAAEPKTFAVTAKAETVPVATPDDAADDPAIWRNPRQGAASLIVTTDKKAGLYVYDVAGRQRSFFARAGLNNVDLLDQVKLGTKRVILVAASDRADLTRAGISLFVLNPQQQRLTLITTLSAGDGEAYGMCLWKKKQGGAVHAFLVLKDGRVRQFALVLDGAQPSMKLVRSFTLQSQAEGCVVDPRTERLFVAEEKTGIWVVSANPDAGSVPTLFAPVDNVTLTADVEGLALFPKGRRGGYLIASSQGDNSYALFSLNHQKPVARFTVKPGIFGATEETDGIAIARGSFGPRFPNGLFVVQDGQNAPQPQNFKYISWQDVTSALATN